MLTASSDPIRESILEKTSGGYWRGGLIRIEREWHSTEHCVSLGIEYRQAEKLYVSMIKRGATTSHLQTDRGRGRTVNSLFIAMI